MSEPTFTIVLPVYNGEPYLQEALQSVFNQTYTNFELVVLENASTDQTRDTLAKLNDTRLNVMSSEEFLSIGDNWARATSIELAPYVVFLSHDDRLKPDFLRTLARLIDKHPDANVLTTHFDLIDASGKILRSSKATPYIETANDYLHAVQIHKRDSYGTGYALRCERFIEIGGIPQLPNLMFADDLLIYSMMKDSYKVCDRSTQFDYRYHERSTARITSLSIAFEAGIQYLNYLNESGYMNHSTRRESAYQYVDDIVIRRHRTLILNVLTATRDDIANYQKQIRQLQLDDRWRGDKDLIVASFKLLVVLPASVRYGIAWCVKQFSKLTWQLRNHR